MTPLALLAALFVFPAASIEVQLFNNVDKAATVSVGPASAAVASYKAGAVMGDEAAKAVRITVRTCRYDYALPETLGEYRASDGGPAKLYLSHQMELFWVPFELELNTPTNFLEPHQPSGFPLRATADCAK